MKLKYFFLPIVASLSFFLIGYESVFKFGWSYVQKNLDLPTHQTEVLKCVSDVAAIVSAVLAGVLADFVGRKYSLAATGGVFFVGNILKAFSTSSYGLLVVGQVVSGFGVGFGLTIAPLYIAEMSPAPTRGLLTSTPEVWLTMGTLSGYLSYYMFSQFPAVVAQRLMFGFATFPSFLLICCTCIMPESPYWILMNHGQVDEATRILENTKRTETETNHILSRVRPEENSNNNRRNDQQPPSKHLRLVWMDLLQLPHRRIVITVASLNILRQLAGVDRFRAHAVLVMYDVPMNFLNWANVAILLLRAIAVMCSSFMVDRIGRRFLLLASLGSTCSFLMMFGLPLFAVQHNIIKVSENDNDKVIVIGLCMVGIAGIVCSFETGIGSITWVHTSEAFKSHRLRAQGISFGVAMNRVAEIIVSVSFSFLASGIRIGGVSLLLFAMMVLGLLFCSYSVKDQGKEILE